MNERAEQALTNLMEKAVEGVEGAVEFSQAEIPVVIEQLLQWEFVLSILWNIPALIIVGAVVFLWKYLLPRIIRENKKDWLKQDEGIMAGGSISLAVATIMGTGVAVAFADFTWLKIWIAPKLFILEYARGFLS